MSVIDPLQLTDVDKVSLHDDCIVIKTKTCYDLTYSPSGDVLLAGNRGFDICDRNAVVQRSVLSTQGDFTSIQYYKDKIYTVLKEPKGSNKRRVIVYSTPRYTECTRWELPDYGYVSMLAVSNDKVYVVDSDAKKIQVYSLKGDLITDFHHSSFKNPVYMSSCSDNGVLLSDWSAGIVYKIDTTADKVVWQFKVATPRGVHCDQAGNVWVWSSKEKALYLRSADGMSSPLTCCWKW